MVLIEFIGTALIIAAIPLLLLRWTAVSVRRGNQVAASLLCAVMWTYVAVSLRLEPWVWVMLAIIASVATGVTVRSFFSRSNNNSAPLRDIHKED